jgi:hypothetical protein
LIVRILTGSKLRRFKDTREQTLNHNLQIQWDEIQSAMG